MNQKTYILIFTGFILLIISILLFVGLFINGSTPSTPSDSNSDFPVIYLTLAVIAGMGLVLGAILRLRK